MDLAEQLRFGPYAVIREIARGGMGVVYEAEDLAGIRVALKVPRSELATDPRERARFLQEMRLTAALRHPNIVQILQGGEDHGRLYLAMEYVEGTTLQHELDRGGKLPPLEVVRIAAQVARGLAAAHGHTPAVVHRDLKPGNILLRNDRVAKVADFGIAKAFDVGADATTSPMGTLVYMCPEQLDAKLSSPASDVHALGLILYEALVGMHPFAATLPVARLIQAICFAVPPAASIASGLGAAIPPELDALVADCLAKAPERRPHAVDIAARLQAIESRLVGGAQTAAPPRVVATPPSAGTNGARAVPPPVDTIALVERFEQRSYATPVIAVAAFLGLTGLGTWMLWGVTPDDVEPAPDATEFPADAYTPPGGPYTPPGNAAPDATAPPAAAAPEAKADANLVAIGGGSFDGHTVGKFWLDVFEVTVAQYSKCVAADKCQNRTTLFFVTESSSSDECNASDKARAQHPINCVDHDDATAYCEWAGKRLPTEREWEWAARGGSKGYDYPWGDQAPEKALAVYSSDGTQPVGSEPNGKSVHGVHDLAGNVVEWTSSSEGESRILRGGGWGGQFLSASYRGLWPPSTRLPEIGFRCARTDGL